MGMTHQIRFFIVMSAVAISCSACSTDAPQKKPTGPTSQTSQIPWNTPIGGQGQGQFGMMPQNQYRR